MVVLAGCKDGSEEYMSDGSDKTEPIAESVQEAEDGYAFFLKDTRIQVNDEISTIVAALGEPTSYFESNSCAFQGLDKVYTYGSVIIRTYPEDGKDYVLSVELKDDSVQTPEGVSIGNTLEFAESIYGKASRKTDASLVYEKGDSALSFISKNNEIYSITYTTVSEG